MSSILFLSEKDPNSVKLHEWIMNNAGKETIKSIQFVSIHREKQKVLKYKIKKVPTLYKNGVFYIGPDIISALEECDPSYFIQDDIFNAPTTFSESYKTAQNKGDDWVAADGTIKPIQCDSGNSNMDLAKAMAEYNAD